MKFNTTKAILGVACAAFAATCASAQTTIYMYGSTAYRKATYVALGNLFGANPVTVYYDKSTAFGGTPTWATTTDKTSASAALGETNLVWTGTIASGTLSGQSVQIYCNWAGSVGGLKSVCKTTPVASGSFGILSGGTITGEAPHVVDIAMSDAYQIESQAASFVPGYENAPDTIVSVLEFLWAKGNDSASDIVNIDNWTCRSILGNGEIDQSQITGATADIGTPVYLTGRDSDSGTRLIGELDCEFNPSLEIFQFNNVSASALTWFGNGTDGLGGGFNVGANVTGALQQAFTYPVTVTDQFGGTTPIASSLNLVGYVAVADATSGFADATPAGSRTLSDLTLKLHASQYLSYNGVAYSEPAINNGYYTYFGVEHCLNHPGASATVTGFKGDLTAQQQAEAGLIVPGTEPLSLLQIARNYDGQDITHN